MQVLVSAWPFTQAPALERLTQAGWHVTCNPYSHKLSIPELIPLVGNCHALIAGTEPITGDVLAAAPHLRVIVRMGVGVDNIALAAAAQRNIQILTTPDAATHSAAEFTLGLMLNLARGISISDRALHKGLWQRHFGTELAGKTLGLLGFGRIAQAFAPLAQMLGMQVQAHDPHTASQMQALQVTPVDFTCLLATSDVLSLHCPLTPATQGILDTSEIQSMKPGALLLNTARGALINEQALLHALTHGPLAGAALDVFDKEPYQGPLCGLPNVILTAHMAANSREARARMEIMAVTALLESTVPH
jgi:D-3-phosphoglycerate dehydrogenase